MQKNTRSDLDFAIFVVFEYLCGKKLMGTITTIIMKGE